MPHSKDALLKSANHALHTITTKDSLNELAVTKLQVHDYHEKILEKINSFPIDFLNDRMLYKILTGTFKHLKDRRNMITEAYIKLYCMYFFHRLTSIHLKDKEQL